MIACSVPNYTTFILTQLRQSMQTLNLYYKIPKAQLSEVSQTTEEISVIQRHRKVTRLYIILFILVH
ncbi:unnamed protein product, partial [Rotaria sp. Silwood1]